MSKNKASAYQFVYPWDDSKFDGKPDDKRSVYYHIKNRGYKVERLKTVDDLYGGMKMVSHLDQVLTSLIVEKTWVMVTSNNLRFLQALANVVPICYSLTTMFSTYNVSTEKLGALFQARKPQDDWRDDPAGETLNKIERARLMVWENVDFPAPSVRIHGSFAELLSRKLSKTPPGLVLFTATMPRFENEAKFAVDLFSHIGEAVGASVMSIVQEEVELMHIQADPSMKPIRNNKF